MSASKRRRTARPWIEAGCVAAIGAVILVDSGGYPPALPGGGPGPAFFPRLLALLLLSGAVALVVRRPPDGPASRPSGSGRQRGWKAAGGMLWVGAFLAGGPFLPRLLALPLLVAGLMVLAGERSRALLVAVPVGFAALVEIGFVTLLGVPLP